MRSSLRKAYYRGSYQTRIGALLKQIPQASEALFWLDGVIVTEGENKYFRDRTANDRKFLISDYDFDSTWVAGFPYKSAATISAPAADADLIAADINNYLYDSGGTPNKIPVVSLFQDIDYEHKIFSRHYAQVVDVNGVETNEPRVLDIVMYNSVRKGTPLSLCQTYFSAPTEDLTAKWVTKSGNDTTGDGSKANPWLTLGKANASATDGDVVYVKTGSYSENSSGSYNLFISKALTINSLGLTYIKGASTDVNVVYLSGAISTTLDGFIVDGAGSFTKGIYSLGSGGTNAAKRCKFIGVTGDAIDMRNEFSFENCITNRPLRIRPTGTTATIKGGYFYGNIAASVLLNVYDGTGADIKYNKTTAYGTIALIYPNAGTINISHNYFDVSLNTSGQLVRSGTTITSTVAFERNIIVSNGIHTADIFEIDTAPTVTLTIKHNNILLSGASNGIDVFDIDGQVNPLIEFNKITTESVNPVSAINITTDVITAPIVRNNYISNKSTGGYIIKVGVEETDANDDKITPQIYNNHIRGANYYAATTGNVHSIFVGFNKNAKVYHNKIDGGLIGVVMKHGGGAYSEGGVFYNLLNNCRIGILPKGVVNMPIYGNTINAGNISNSRGISSETQSPEMSGLLLKNNIITGDSSTFIAINIHDGGETGLVSDNNVIYAPNGVVGSYQGADKSWSEWQALGLDVSSQNTNPSLAELIPDTAIEIGADLGINYDDGLDITTFFGETPAIVTKQQAETWQVGAFVK